MCATDSSAGEWTPLEVARAWCREEAPRPQQAAYKVLCGLPERAVEAVTGEDRPTGLNRDKLMAAARDAAELSLSRAALAALDGVADLKAQVTTALLSSEQHSMVASANWILRGYYEAIGPVETELEPEHSSAPVEVVSGWYAITSQTTDVERIRLPCGAEYGVVFWTDRERRREQIFAPLHDWEICSHERLCRSAFAYYWLTHRWRPVHGERLLDLLEGDAATGMRLRYGTDHERELAERIM